jgi:hypothetical protein
MSIYISVSTLEVTVNYTSEFREIFKAAKYRPTNCTLLVFFLPWKYYLVFISEYVRLLIILFIVSVFSLPDLNTVETVVLCFHVLLSAEFLQASPLKRNCLFFRTFRMSFAFLKSTLGKLKKKPSVVSWVNLRSR